MLATSPSKSNYIKNTEKLSNDWGVLNSSQKEGKPNAALCFILEVYFGLRKNRVFLQHGITQSDARWLYYDVTKLNLFICAVKDEYDYISKTFNYPKNTVQLCGFSRYDNLLSPYQIKRQILVMPTMRDWLRIQSSDTLKYEVSHDFYQSDYYKHWNSLINSNRLHKILCEYNIDVVFYLHAGMQKYVDYFASDNQRVIIGRPKEYDVQQLLKESCVLITDYSSVFFDFAYMEKPLIYFQFDYEKFRRGQYQQGFFSYENNGFGPVVQTEAALLDKLEMILKCNCEMPEKYRSRTIQFFTYRDTHNCGRIYNAIANMKI